MCTVVIRVPASSDEPTRVLAIRDEDPSRPWNPLGRWWPESHDGVLGVRDIRAGGAWLAADPGESRLAVLLNRADVSTRPESEITSRGNLVLDSVAGRTIDGTPTTHGFNLVEVDGPSARVVTWDGETVHTQELAPGTHMIAHDDVDDASTPRIARWLDDFRSARLEDDERWWDPWIEILERTAELDSTDDAAIIRDNRPYGYPTLSLLACVASVGADTVDVRYGELSEPGRLDGLDLS
ncbi:NRDE family protein [Microbacterium sp. SLBN-146]|uniref:NRDE family protein n=1 Tax=Microbacterium sp. SLBN-146 TaxID=2768457 RepID=UPI00114F7492|nr:NRDE family protein [Microbacterium sp. SLBN-146]TQJ32529.1 transport and Golgi organization protein 2 [Microbacterium sp. SLBN-146]